MDVPGRRGERNEVVVTDETRTIMGIRATVVRDTETRNGVLVEDTLDWYAQDRSGNVWYLGEATRAVRNGEVSVEGSWEAGVDGALPGIVMKANPRVGDAYRQEFYRGHAEDMGEVIRTGASESVPYRSRHGLLVTRDWTRWGQRSWRRSSTPGTSVWSWRRPCGADQTATSWSATSPAGHRGERA